MPLSVNAFTILGLPQRFTLEPRQLDRLQREAYVAHKNEGISALEAINFAYRRLKSPVTRAELLFDLRGWSTKIEPEQTLLERVFAARDAIASAKQHGDKAFLLDWASTARKRYDALCADLGVYLDDETKRGSAEREEAAVLLEELRYLSRALAEVQSALHVIDEASIQS